MGKGQRSLYEGFPPLHYRAWRGAGAFPPRPTDDDSGAAGAAPD